MSACPNFSGAIAQDGRIEPGDMILEVNGISFENMSNDDAVRTLREAVQKPGWEELSRKRILLIVHLELLTDIHSVSSAVFVLKW